MRSRVLLAAMFCGSNMIVGCAPTIENVSWKPGTTPIHRASDETNCEVQSVQQVPASMAIGQTPTFTTPTYVSPVQTSCHDYGYGASCTTTGGQVSGGQVSGGQVYSYDANKGLRERVVAQCMAQKGYSTFSFASCSADDLKAGVAHSASSPMPRPEQILCVTPDGGFVQKPSAG